MSKPTVALVLRDGMVEEYFITEGVRVLVISEDHPNDRVYQMAANCTERDIQDLIGESPIGSAQDERHEAVAAKVKAFMKGERHLKPVKD